MDSEKYYKSQRFVYIFKLYFFTFSLCICNWKTVFLLCAFFMSFSPFQRCQLVFWKLFIVRLFFWNCAELRQRDDRKIDEFVVYFVCSLHFSQANCAVWMKVKWLGWKMRFFKCSACSFRARKNKRIVRWKVSVKKILKNK